MNEKDDSTLEYLYQTGSAEPQGVILWNMHDKDLADFSYTTLGRRLRKLVEYDLVEIPRGNGDGDPYYRITEKGRQYLAGEYKPD